MKVVIGENAHEGDLLIKKPNGKYYKIATELKKPMTKNDDIKVGDKVIAKPVHHYHVCTISTIKKGWILNKYLVHCPHFGTNTYYKKYRWQLFKIN